MTTRGPMISSALHGFLKWEAAGGIVLFGAAALALIAANTALAPHYEAFLDLRFSLRLGPLGVAKSLLVWVNDLLMAVFFLLVGLEIKRELVEGELSSMRQALLPLLGAVGGMAVPAAIYLSFNLDNPERANGWAIPAATDIAFALGVIGLLARSVPPSIKILLTAIAIFDDLVAIAIIAAFYTGDLSREALLAAAAAITALGILNARGVAAKTPYVLIGAALWLAVLKSGVHATLAGVVLALFIPLKTAGGKSPGPLHQMERALHPWVAFAILPLFGFVNAGVSFANLSLDSLFDPVTLGIAAGLFAGKQIGVFGALALAIGLGLSRRPNDANWLHLYGLAAVCGVGFTMSLFIGNLAFEDDAYTASVRLGVIAGSLASITVGLAIFALAPRAR